MKITHQEVKNTSDLISNKWDVGILSEPLDDRGKNSVEYIRTNATSILKLKYLPTEFKMLVGNISYNSEEDSYLQNYKNKSVILDATTLGFAELLIIIKAFNNLGLKKIDILYLEPQNYNNPRRGNLLSKMDFDLTGEVFGYRAIPGTTLMLSDRVKQRGVFLLGYEESRFDRVLEDFEIVTSNCFVVFGVPAFKTGWELPSLINNIRVIRDKNVRGDVQYCSAANPDSSVKLLNEIYESLSDEERMFIVPLSSTPISIGVALFLTLHNDVGILYDHPERSLGRSADISKSHLYEIDFKFNTN